MTTKPRVMRAMAPPEPSPAMARYMSVCIGSPYLREPKVAPALLTWPLPRRRGCRGGYCAVGLTAGSGDRLGPRRRAARRDMRLDLVPEAAQQRQSHPGGAV